MVKTLIPALALACASLTFAPHQASAAPFGAAVELSTVTQGTIEQAHYYGYYRRRYYRPRYYYHRPRYYGY